MHLIAITDQLMQNIATCLCVTAYVPTICLSTAPPSSNVDPTVSWDIFGVIATYTCPPGWYFAEGGTRRTMTCTNGRWPPVAPTCIGKSHSFVYRCLDNWGAITSRLRSSQILPKVHTRTKRYCSFIQYGLNHYQ